MTQPKLSDRIAGAVAAVQAAGLSGADTAIILGSGLGSLAKRVSKAVDLAYSDIPGMPRSTAPGHSGRLIGGNLFGRRCVIMQGRFHLYEGWQAADIAFPVYVMKALGAQQLIITNASGALNTRYSPGDVMLIEDHLNFTGVNPLTGPNDDNLGLRFPDMSRAYSPELRELARTAAGQAGVTLTEGIYAGIAGPSLETSAERRFLRNSGGDAVGMSTVTETIAAAHAGLPVLGLSAITNAASGGPDQQPDTIEEVLDNAATAGVAIAMILERLLTLLESARPHRAG